MHDLSNPGHPDVRTTTAQWTSPAQVGDLISSGEDHLFLGRHATGRPGSRVFVVDPGRIFDVPDHRRNSPNLLTGMLDANDPEYAAAAARIATAMLPSSNVGDPFFANEARACIQAACLQVLKAPSFEGKVSLMTVAEILLNGDIPT